MRKKCLHLALAMLMMTAILSPVFSQLKTGTRPVAAKISALLQDQVKFKQVGAFTVNSVTVDQLLTSAKYTTYATLNIDQLNAINEAKDGAIEFSFPFNGEIMTVLLYKAEIFTSDFKVVTDQSDGHSIPYNPGLYYQGIVKGDENSLASVSFFEDELMGLISSNEFGNINIGRMANQVKGTDYIIYSDKDLTDIPAIECATFDDPAYSEKLKEYALSGSSVRTINCVKMYYETDYNIYTSSGSTTTGVTNWMTAVHNNVATIYTNDQVNTAISQIFIWTTQDPFTGSTSSARLSSFKSNRPSFNGDVGQLVAIDPGGLGGVASTINGLCSSTNKYCYSDVDYAYNNFPTYSWTVMVLTHEFGHLLGSYHTHNCSWPGGAIDNCYTTEGGCPAGPAPTNGGTIMSYCHLTSYGINFNNGFGTYPGNAIRGAVDAAPCMTSSCTGGGGTSYCASKGNNATEEWIQTVQFGSFSNNSGSNAGYGNFTAQTVSMASGSSTSFTLTPGFNGGPWNEYFSIWIDYNKDFDFTDAGENVYNSGATTVAVSGSFTVPSGLTGTTRMRVSLKYNALATSCETFSYGEVEDYTVSFTGGGGGPTYCASKGNNATEEWIDYFQLGSITRSSGSDGGYYNGTALSTNLIKNTSNTATYSIGFNGGPWNEYFRIWIDYNKDGDFVDANEQVAQKTSTSSGNLTSAFTVPSTALTGTTRLRISMKYNAYPTSCETFSYGEVEDYTVNILNQMITELPTGQFEFTMYPNPTLDLVMMEMNGTLESGRIELLDMSGRLLKSYPLELGQNTMQMNLGDLTPAVYLVRVISGDKIILSDKLIKQ